MVRWKQKCFLDYQQWPIQTIIFYDAVTINDKLLLFPCAGAESLRHCAGDSFQTSGAPANPPVQQLSQLLSCCPPYSDHRWDITKRHTVFFSFFIPQCDRAHVVLWTQMQVSLASSAASRRSSSNTSLRAPLVWHYRSTVIIEKKCRSEWLTATFCCSSTGGFSANLWEVTTVSQELRDMNSSSSSRTRSAEDVEEPLNGVPNPTACLHVGDIILFTLSTHHYPEYDLWVYLGIHLYPC